ncbi:MAG: hypothetical protein HY884_07360 [Deltaproteobacteria bacterium]|nr:hypothetical protein [Deltaproteobacteria bacterium]
MEEKALVREFSGFEHMEQRRRLFNISRRDGFKMFGGYFSKQGLLLGLGFMAVFWVLETFLHRLFFHAETFSDAFFSTDPNEVWMRAFIALLLLFWTSYTMALKARNRHAIEVILKAKSKIIKGLIPVCSYCKKVRYSDGSWHGIERFVTDKSSAEFTHGICPECMGRVV